MQGQARVLEYLKDRFDRRPPILKNVQLLNGLDYVSLCTHSEILGRVWFELQKALPENCRDVVYGNPVLRHPRTGLLFAIGHSVSTYYAIRIPSRILREVQFGETDFVRVMHVNRQEKKTFDLRVALGSGWIFGSFRETELDWCRAAYIEAGEDPA